jgi:hypothetical protein
MAFTVLGVHQSNADSELVRTALFISQEYIPHKDTDSTGAVLPDQEWQHPEPENLHYCKLGVLTGDERVQGLIQCLFDLGADQLGGHARIMFLEQCSWITHQIESWADRHARCEQERIERERQHEIEMAAEQALRAPVYDYCPRCCKENEQCKDPHHRGQNRCMTCNGGLGDPTYRRCTNCLDLPCRQKRDAKLGQAIVYTGEELPR